LPNFPNGEDEESQECTRIELVEEMKKSLLDQIRKKNKVVRDFRGFKNHQV